MTIGEKIKHLRKKQGISQIDFATKIGISKQTLYKYENNVITNIPSNNIEKSAKLLNCSPAYLMGWETDKSQEYKHGEFTAELLKKYDLLSESNKTVVLNIIDTLLLTQSK